MKYGSLFLSFQGLEETPSFHIFELNFVERYKFMPSIRYPNSKIKNRMFEGEMV